MWFGAFQAGIAYSDLKADCGGAALNMQSFPSPTESARGYRGDGDMDCLYRHGADRSLKLDRRVFHAVRL